MTKFKVGDKVKVNIKDCHNRIRAVDENIIGEVVYIDEIFPKKTLQVKVHNENLYGAWGYGGIRLEKYEGGWWHEEDAILLEEAHFPLYSEEAAVKLLTERGYEVKAPPEPLKGTMVIYCAKGFSKPYYMSKEGWDNYIKAEPDWMVSKTILAIVDWTEGQGL